MSTRWYPLYCRGNPQLRVFLPNFWMKLVKPDKKYPPNTAVFRTSLEMTKHDVRNYLEKIYKINVVDINLEIKQGKTRKQRGRANIVKDDDYKEAVITLPREEKFEFPNIYPKDHKDEVKELKEAQEKHAGYSRRNLHRPGVPGWFSF